MERSLIREGETGLPLSYPEVAGGTATQVAALGVGAAVAAGCLRGATLVDVLAAATELLVLEAGWTHALVAPQGVVAGGSSADVCAETLVLICEGTRTHGSCVAHRGDFLGEVFSGCLWLATGGTAGCPWRWLGWRGRRGSRCDL